jgi:ABC-type transporter Mla maintaining outer membrane lipid asymmetry ATPase subunit MlaF
MSSGHAGPAVVFEQVFKAFGSHQVLRNVSFSVPAGEALCILGRSGTGKSVTLKLLIALLTPDRGTIWVDGEDITRLKPTGLSKVRRKMGFLFQDAALFDSLTLYENLALPLARLTTKSRAEIDFAVNDVLRQVELEGDQGKLPSDLSGGMRTEGASGGRTEQRPRSNNRLRNRRAAAASEARQGDDDPCGDARRPRCPAGRRPLRRIG